MTVNELIAELQKVEPEFKDYPVGIMGSDYNIERAAWVGFQNVRYESENVPAAVENLAFPSGCHGEMFVPFILIRSV